MERPMVVTVALREDQHNQPNCGEKFSANRFILPQQRGGSRRFQKRRRCLWRSAWLLAAVIAVGFPAARLTAQEEISKEWLGAGDYSLRQQTTRQMWGAREQTRDLVEQAARDPDPEVAARARWILQRWREGVFPDTPLDVQRKLAGRVGVERLEGLLDAGLYEDVVVAIEQSMGTPEGLQIRTEVSEALQRRFAFYLRGAVENDQVGAFCELLDVTAEGRSLAIARIRLLKRLGYDLDEVSFLPQSAKRWSEEEKQQTTIIGLVVIGEIEQALETARAAGLGDWERGCLVLSGRWEELAEVSKAEAEGADEGTAEAYRMWAQCIVAATRADLPALREKAAEHLAEPTAETLAPEIQQLRWRSLLIHGFVDSAIALLEETDKAAAAEVLESLGRLDDAFAVLDVDPHDPAAAIQRWYEKAAISQKTGRASDLSSGGANEDIENLLAIGRLLLKAGHVQLARQLYQDAARLPDADGSDRSARLHVVRALWFSSHREWALEFATDEEGKQIYPDTLAVLSNWLPNSDPQTFAILWQALGEIKPDDTAYQRLKLISQLFAGEPPAGFDAPKQIEDLYQEIVGGKPTVSRVNGRLVVTGRDYMTTELGTFFLRLGHNEIANQIYLQRSEKGDATGDLQLAQFQLARGNAAEALQTYRRIWQQHAAVGAGVRRVNLSGWDMSASLKAAVGEAIALQRLGDLEASEQQFELVRLMLYVPSGFVRMEVAEYLVEWDKESMARETLLALLRSSAVDQDETVPFIQVARTYGDLVSDVEPGEAARWTDLAMSGTLETSAFFPRAYLVLPAQHHGLYALDAAQKRDAEGVKKHLDSALTLQPLAIDMAEELLPRLRELGMASEADEVLDRIFHAGHAYTEQFGLDASMANNLAWVVALSGMHLEEAMELAERACFLVPDSVSYRDTLAEILFRRGEREQAVLIEQHCLLDEPGEWHLHQQIERFTSAK